MSSPWWLCEYLFKSSSLDLTRVQDLNFDIALQDEVRAPNNGHVLDGLMP